MDAGAILYILLIVAVLACLCGGIGSALQGPRS